MRASLIQSIVVTIVMMVVTQAVAVHVYEALEIADKYNYALTVIAQR